MIIAQFLLGSWNYADSLQQISCYLLISALRAGQVPSPHPVSASGKLVDSTFLPPICYTLVLDDLCLKSNNCLGHCLPSQIPEG